MADERFLDAARGSVDERSSRDERPAGDERPWVAIGDVHGRADLLAAMLDTIERTMPDARVVLLGDLIDRGPDVRGAVALAMTVPERFEGGTVLLGNHEDWLLASIDGDPDVRESWLTWGGAATCHAYGIDPARALVADRAWLADAFAPHAAHLDFLRARPRRLNGDGSAAGHLFVHAGVDPERPLDRQDERDLIWMREPFLSWPRPLARTIVHGHTIAERPELRAHRIGVDTGAYRSGVLSAVVLGARGSPSFIAATVAGVGAIRADR